MDSRDSSKITVAELVRRGKAIYWNMPGPVRWLLLPAKALWNFLAILRPHVWLMTGNEISGGQPLGVIFAGLEIDKNYIRSLAFGDSCREQRIGRKWLWNVRKACQKSGQDCSLLILEAPHCAKLLSAKLKYLFIPSWIDGQVDIAAERASLFSNRNESLRSDLRRIRKNNLRFEATNSLSDLDDFYYRMYMPYIVKTHGDRSKIMTYGYVKTEFKKRRTFTELLLIKQEQECIAGILIHYSKRKAKLMTLGVKDGNPDYLDHGAVGAAYHFAIQHLAEKGHAKIDLGGSRPFLKDGVLRYKRKWRQRVSGRKGPAFLVKVLAQTPGLRSFLANNPFVHQDATGLCGAVFADGDKPLGQQDFVTIYKGLYVEGLSKLVIYRFDGGAAGASAAPVPAEFADKMAVAPAETLLTTVR